MCCKLMPMKQDANDGLHVNELKAELVHRGFETAADMARMRPDFYKPAGQRCPFQKHHKGCSIYNERPFGCRFWNCRWLVNDDTADLPRPDRAGYVIDLMPDYITVEGKDIEVVQVWLSHPDNHKDPKLRAYLARRGEEGKAAICRINERDAIILFPPALNDDGQWHERYSTANRGLHTPEELHAFFDK